MQKHFGLDLGRWNLHFDLGKIHRVHYLACNLWYTVEKQVVKQYFLHGQLLWAVTPMGTTCLQVTVAHAATSNRQLPNIFKIISELL